MENCRRDNPDAGRYYAELDKVREELPAGYQARLDTVRDNLFNDASFDVHGNATFKSDAVLRSLEAFRVLPAEHPSYTLAATAALKIAAKIANSGITDSVLFEHGLLRTIAAGRFQPETLKGIETMIREFIAPGDPARNQRICEVLKTSMPDVAFDAGLAAAESVITKNPASEEAHAAMEALSKETWPAGFEPNKDQKTTLRRLSGKHTKALSAALGGVRAKVAKIAAE